MCIRDRLYGYEKYVSFDLGMVNHFDYYTGIIFRGYTYGTGDAIGKGGRYDNLLAVSYTHLLIDVILPVMDGFTVIEKTNGNRSIKKKPIFIVISSMGNQSMVEYACKLGVHYYICLLYTSW